MYIYVYAYMFSMKWIMNIFEISGMFHFQVVINLTAITQYKLAINTYKFWKKDIFNAIN